MRGSSLVEEELNCPLIVVAEANLRKLDLGVRRRRRHCARETRAQLLRVAHTLPLDHSH